MAILIITQRQILKVIQNSSSRPENRLHGSGCVRYV